MPTNFRLLALLRSAKAHSENEPSAPEFSSPQDQDKTMVGIEKWRAIRTIRTIFTGVGWAAWMAAVLLDRNVQRLECSCHYPPDALNTYCISWSSRGRCDRTIGHGAYASSSGATTSSASVTFPSSSSGGQAHGLFTHGCPGFRLLAAWSFQLVRDPIYEAVI
jgi:hypothetical protein